jgi:hypothetical protein
VTQLKELAGDLVFTIAIAGQATAGTADEFTGFVAPFNLKITGVKWVPAAAVTADPTNNCVVNLRNRGAAAAGAALPASRSYAATNSAAYVSEAMTLSATAADLLVSAGDVLTVSKVNGGTGLALPKGTVQVHAQVR